MKNNYIDFIKIFTVPLFQLIVVFSFLPKLVLFEPLYLTIFFLSFYFFVKEFIQSKQSPLKINPLILLLNVLFFVFYLLLTLFTQDILSDSSFIFFFCYLVLVLAILITSFILFIDIEVVCENFFKIFFLFPCTFLICTYPIFQNFAWMYICKNVTKIVYLILILFRFYDVSFIPPYTLQSPDFKISIFSPCSGLEGILLFTSVFSFILILSNIKNISKVSILIWYLFGILSMWFLNIFRITTYFIFGVYVSKNSNSMLPDYTEKIIIQIFHSNIGWILYSFIIGIIIFLFLKFRKM